MQASPFSYHELHTNNTKIIQNQKPFQNQNFNSPKLCTNQGPLKVTNISLNTDQKEINQKTS
jgi:hypothetical protein